MKPLRVVALSAALLTGCHDYDRLTLCIDEPERPECLAADPGAGASRCSEDEAALCDGFETGSLAATWTDTDLNGTVTVEAGNVCRGDGALHIVTAASPLEDPIEADVTTTIDDGSRHYALRWFMWLSEIPENRTVLASLAPALAPEAGYQLGVSRGFLGLYDPVRAAWLEQPLAEVPIGRWVCLELEVVEADADGAVSLRLDGTALDDLDIAGDTLGADPIAQVYLGWLSGTPVDPQPAIDLWIDEVAVSDGEIGCHE